MKVEIDLPEIEGYEYTGEYRGPKCGEFVLSDSLSIAKANECFKPMHILEPVEKWIVPTIEYMQEHYRWGERPEVRVRDSKSEVWNSTEGLININMVDDDCERFECYWDYYKYCEIKERR